MKNKLYNSPAHSASSQNREEGGGGCSLIKYNIIVSYDGTAYHGWQAQPGKSTIVGTLEQTFRKIFDTEIAVFGASRTDAGVHARGQVAVFSTSIRLPAHRIQFAWNNMLPDDIVITSLEIADPVFHPLYNVKQKTYRYVVYSKRPLPFVARYGWYYYRKLNMDRFQAALAQFLGTHDFRAFCTIEDIVIENTIRTIDSIDVLYDTELDAYRIEIKGERFLRYMIRRMIGAAVKVASDEKIPLEIIAQTLQKKDPSHTLPNAPACGLTLMKIEYLSKG